MRVVAPLVPRQKSDRLKGVPSYVTSGDWGQGSYWKGSVVDDGKAHIASACFECVPSSGGYEAFICSVCSDAGWSTVKHRSFHSVVSHSQLAALLASPVVAPTIVLKPRSSCPKIKPTVQAFRDMLEFDSGWSLVEDAIVANAAALLAVETASFDTQRSDELSIDEIVALSTDIEAAAAEVAAVRPEALAAFVFGLNLQLAPLLLLLILLPHLLYSRLRVQNARRFPSQRLCAPSPLRGFVRVARLKLTSSSVWVALVPCRMLAYLPCPLVALLITLYVGMLSSS